GGSRPHGAGPAVGLDPRAVASGVLRVLVAHVSPRHRGGALDPDRSHLHRPRTLDGRTRLPVDPPASGDRVMDGMVPALFASATVLFVGGGIGSWAKAPERVLGPRLFETAASSERADTPAA